MSEKPKDSPSNDPKVERLKKSIALISLVVSSEAMVVWLSFQTPLLKAGLLPDYLGSKYIASGFFPIFFLVALGYHRKTSQDKMRTFLTRWIAAFVFSFALCFLVNQIFTNHWDPDAAWEILIYPLWISVFIVIFISLPFSIVLITYLYFGNDAGPKK